eukprot:9065039-Alexandrium_andersonii.AAC.1
MRSGVDVAMRDLRCTFVLTELDEARAELRLRRDHADGTHTVSSDGHVLRLRLTSAGVDDRVGRLALETYAKLFPCGCVAEPQIN